MGASKNVWQCIQSNPVKPRYSSSIKITRFHLSVLTEQNTNTEVSYRFRLDFYSDENLQTSLSLHDRYSNLFMASEIERDQSYFQVPINSAEIKIHRINPNFSYH